MEIISKVLIGVALILLVLLWSVIAMGSRWNLIEEQEEARRAEKNGGAA